MKKLYLYLFIISLSISSVVFGESIFTGQISQDYNTKYLFRGGYSGDNLVDNTFEVGKENFAIGIWQASWDGGDEVDFYASYSFPTFDVGVTAYTYPNDGAEDSSQLEFYIAKSIDLKSFTLDLAYYHGSEGFDSDYESLVEVGGSRSVSVLDLAATVGYWASGEGHFVNLSVGSEVPLGSVTLSPYVAYASLYIDAPGSSDDNVSAGFTVAISF